MLKLSLRLLLLFSSFLGGTSPSLAQNNIQPCRPNDVQCMFDQQQNNQRANQQLNFRTPQQIQERKVDNATTTCQDSNSATCQKIESKLDDPQRQNIPLRELQQQRLNQQLKY